jgi:hypothetical protein
VLPQYCSDMTAQCNGTHHTELRARTDLDRTGPDRACRDVPQQGQQCRR